MKEMIPESAPQVNNTALAIDLPAKINQAHAASRSAFARGVEHAMEAGRLLNEAKDQVQHGKWLTWLKDHCPDISENLAQRYMRVARELPALVEADPANTARVPDLSFRGALEYIASAKRPDADVEQDDPAEAPILTHGYRYYCDGESPHGQCVVEIAEHPDHPGYWVYSIDHYEAGFVDYCQRGVKQTALQALIVGLLADEHEFAGVGDWHTVPVDEGRVPLAVEMDRLNKLERKGRWSWLARNREVREEATADA